MQSPYLSDHGWLDRGQILEIIWANYALYPLKLGLKHLIRYVNSLDVQVQAEVVVGS